MACTKNIKSKQKVAHLKENIGYTAGTLYGIVMVEKRVYQGK